MNVEELREYCLSLGDDVDERLPFVKFKAAQGVLVFYVLEHMFCYFNLDDFNVITLKCQPEKIVLLREKYDCVCNPYNANPKHWIGLRVLEAKNSLVKELVSNSYEIVKAKYKKNKRK
ncbi:MAG: MmcQ/YjbR family DNA-binding protein [Bacteroidales bacterium]|nr:MmcQ/YjbR family DNA-binding protein [Bacteroidales bacterium]MDY6424742.1 MmcQ/YjbR family DNA-binding protein [Bacteroidales bacterium]